MKKRNRLRGRGSLCVLLAGAGAAGIAGVAVAGHAGHNPVPAASIGGGYNHDGKVFAKTGQPLTLTVSGSNVNCVVYEGTADLTPPFVFALSAAAGEGLKSVQATAYQKEDTKTNTCESNSASATATYTVDNSGPQISADLAPQPANGWNNQDVTLTWSATDVSGIKSGPTPATDTVDVEGADTKTSEATDNLGTKGTGSQVVRLDKSPPRISASVSPEPNDLGWNRTDVSVAFVCADQATLSGIAECPSTASVTREGKDLSVPGTAKDFAGNAATISPKVSIDKTAPGLQGVPQGTPSNGWYNDDVTVAWSCGDRTGSGVVSCPGPTTITGEGSALTDTRTISDNAGNETTATSAPAVKIDRAPPVTTATAPSGWTNRNARVTLSGSDAGSGVDGTYYKVNGGTSEVYTDGVQLSEEGEHTLAFWSVDRAGNAERATTIAVKVDKGAPTIRHALSPAANEYGWNNSAVAVTFACEDDRSGIASCGPNEVVATEGVNQAVEGTARDNAGNTATRTALVSVDLTRPTISASVDRAPNGNGWYKDDVTVEYQCDDALSRVLACPGSETIGAGEDQQLTRSASDTAGNQASARVSGINVDKRAPTIAGAPTTDANENGWYRDDVIVAWTCEDAGEGQSGLAAGACPDESTVGGEGAALSTSASVVDRAGNESTASVRGIKIDRHAPLTTAGLPAAVADGWHAGPVRITLPASDNMSGVAATHYRIGGSDTQEYTGEFTLDRNGSHELSFWSVDEAGNVESPRTVDVKIDTENPTIAGSRPDPNGNGWYNGSVGVTFNCADAHSGVKSCSEGVTVDTEGAGQSFKGEVEDRVGNKASTTVGGINIDVTAPTVTGKATTEPNANGWYRGDVVMEWTCVDELSGLAGSCPAARTIAGEGANLGAVSGDVADKAGNVGSASVDGINIDRTAPTVAITAPVDGASVSADTVEVSGTASDDGSGLDAVKVDGADAGVSDGRFSRSVSLACGANTIAAESLDEAGNRRSAEIKVTRNCVTHTVGHALAPIATSDNSQTKKEAANHTAFKIKSVIPVKFQVFRDANRNELMTTPPEGSYATLSLTRHSSSTSSTDQAELVSGTANSGDRFRWSGSPDNQYIYNLSTSGRAAGRYSVTLTLYDASGKAIGSSEPQHFILRS